MLQMMVDLETLSLSTRAVVFQIGVAVFNFDGKIEHSERLDVDILPQIMCGRIVDSSTQQWWMTQEVSSWVRPAEQVNDVESCLDALSLMWKEYQCKNLWANSPSFDGVILKSLYEDFRMKPFWSHKEEMDCRTVKKLAKMMGGDSVQGEPSHDAEQDCRDQVENLIQNLGQMKVASQLSFVLG